MNQIKETDLNYLQISNTLFNFYYAINDLNRFNLMKDSLTVMIEQLNINTVEELELTIKFKYNLCRYLWLQDDVDNAIKTITSTIQLCKEHKTFYLLADLFLLLANISKKFSDKLVVKRYMETAYFLYKLEDNEQMFLTIERYISDNF